MGKLRSAICSALTLVSVACGRTYEAKAPPTVSGAVLNARLDRVNVSLTTVTIATSTNALAQTQLRQASITHVTDPCGKGVPFNALELDGVPALAGPSDIAGPHRLHLMFAEQAVARPLHAHSALDLDIESPAGRSCVRVALPMNANDDRWHNRGSGVGFFFNVGARAYPALSKRIDGARPGLSLEERVGADFDEYRLWAGLAVDPGGAPPSERFLVFGLGLDRQFWEQAHWGFWFGAGYDLVLDLHDTGAPGPLATRHTLQGPRLTPGISYTFFRGDLPVYMYPRPVLLRVGLDAPSAIWFGTGSAPRATVVSAVMLGVAADL